jgi:hypothetical protein
MSGKKKSDVQQILGILDEFDDADLRIAIDRRGLAAARLLPVPLAALSVVNTPTVTDEPCPTDNAYVSTSSEPSNVEVSVDNTGDCQLVVKVSAGGGELGRAVVAPGKSGSICVAGATRVEVDCQACDSGCSGPRCKFTRKVVWS